MRVGYIGNFGPSHSTETHVSRAFTSQGHTVTQLQENEPLQWFDLDPSRFDMILWTRTGWDWKLYGTTAGEAHVRQRRLIELSAERGVPTVGYHLDRWWGLSRQGEISTEPFFCVSLLITADGGHQEQWAAAGINHAWLPPGVSAPECAPCEPHNEYRSRVAFVGSWENYHTEWRHRFDLVKHLRDNWDCAFWPKPRTAVRGDELRKLYASTEVNVGDSCLLGNADSYWSDRIPETLGRGGFLIHPHVNGLDEHFQPGEHLATWAVNDWAGLDERINYYLECPDERKRIAASGRAHVLAHHTYEVRVGQIIALAGLA